MYISSVYTLPDCSSLEAYSGLPVITKIAEVAASQTVSQYAINPEILHHFLSDLMPCVPCYIIFAWFDRASQLLLVLSKHHMIKIHLRRKKLHWEVHEKVYWKFYWELPLGIVEPSACFVDLWMVVLVQEGKLRYPWSAKQYVEFLSGNYFSSCFQVSSLIHDLCYLSNG